MKHAHLLSPLRLAALSFLLAAPAHASCWADYKAKQDNPLRLQYGLIELPSDACGSHGAAEAYARPVIARSGWTLLQIESILTDSQAQSRSANAGAIHRRR